MNSHRFANLVSATAIGALFPSALAITIDGNLDDWDESGTQSAPAVVEDGADHPDISGDIRRIAASVADGNLLLELDVEGIACPAPDETPEGKTNRYYYHWLFDTDNNPATGFSNSEYEGNATNLENPIGADLVIQVGWRNGAPDGIYAYDPLTEQDVVRDYTWSKEGHTISASIPLDDLGLSPGQTVALSAFQEGASDGWLVDWVESTTLVLDEASGSQEVAVDDPADHPDISGDLRGIALSVSGESLVLNMAVEGVFSPSPEETPEGKTNRYYYHWILDTDNNPATGFSNSEYEGNPTNLGNPIGADIVVQIGWRNGVPDGVYAYNPLNEVELVRDYPWEADGSSVQAMIPLDDLGLSLGQTIAFSAFQEGASDGWLVDWMESGVITLEEAAGGANIVDVEDPGEDLDDSSGDLTSIHMTVDEEYVYFGMTVRGTVTPAPDETPEGKTNRYYYHWILDTDNNPATGFSNSEYEGNATGLEMAIGADLVVQVGWRNGAPDGVYAYNPLTEVELIRDYEWKAEGNTLEAKIKLSDLGLSSGQTIAFSSFQEGASDGWAVDWMEPGVITLTPPSSGGADLVSSFRANPYGYEIILEDLGDDIVNPDSIAVTVDGDPAPAQVTKDDEITTVGGVFSGWLASGQKHTLGIEYQVVGSTAVRSRDIPFDAPAYSILPAKYANATVNKEDPGFVANVTQISDAQAESPSQHNNQSSRAEQQLAGELVDFKGKPFQNEASDVRNRWQLERVEVEGVINWYELAPDPTGHFFEDEGRADEPFPAGEEPLNGMVIEILTYLELEAGFHQFAVNTTGGYKFSVGPDGRDKLLPAVGVFNGERNYSYQGDHYFNLLAPEPGLYPVRLLWFHSQRTKEDAQLEFYSIAGKRKVLVNDPDAPEAVKAYRSASSGAPYVSKLSPAPDEQFVQTDAAIEMEIIGFLKEGTLQLNYDGAPVAAEIDVDDDITTVRYQPPAAAWGSTHTVELSYQTAGEPSQTRMESFSYGHYTGVPSLPTEWAGPVGSGAEPGFSVRTVQTLAGRANSVDAAEAQLKTEGDFSAEQSVDVINFSIFEASGDGLFFDDIGLFDAELVSPDSNDFVSMEAIAYLALDEGGYTMGINSDDGFRVTAGLRPEETELEFDRYDGGRGVNQTEPQNLFSFVVEKAGVYAFRLLWYQGTGDASVEWYTYNRTNGQAILLNADDANSVKAFQERSREPGAAAPEIRIRRSGAEIVLEWEGQLESTRFLDDDEWTPLPEATSPLTIDPKTAEPYYRSR